MESRANYFLIGSFTLAAIFAGFGFLLWLAKAEVDQSYASYDILFESVAGLSKSGDVRYNGLLSGRVIAMDIDPEAPSKVRVRIEVSADLPVRADTVARLQAQGVTGVTYVALSGGSAGAEALPNGALIRSERSAIQSVMEGAPAFLEEALLLLKDVRAVVNDENRAAVETLLANLATSSARLDQALADFQDLTGNIGDASIEVGAFARKLQDLSDTAEVTLATATDALTVAKATIQRTEGAVIAAETTFETANSVMQGELTSLIRSARATSDTMNATLKSLEPGARATLAATQSLTEDQIPALISQATKTAANIDQQVSLAGQTLEDASALFVSARASVEEDVRLTLQDLRGTLGTISTVVDGAAEDIDAIGGQVRLASASVANTAQTFEGIVVENRRQMSDFLRVGLPQIQKLAEEGADLFSNMKRLVRRIERDPARFLLGTQTSEYRR